MKEFEKIMGEHEDWNKLNARIQEEIVILAVTYASSLFYETMPCESPIEQLLAVHLWDLLSLKTNIADEKYYILNQQDEIETDVGMFRVDFNVCAQIGGQSVSLIVECDGHDYHEKTKAQARKDKMRDRALKRAGHEIIHFTGSEIWADPHKCALEVMRQMIAMANKGRQ